MNDIDNVGDRLASSSLLPSAASEETEPVLRQEAELANGHHTEETEAGLSAAEEADDAAPVDGEFKPAAGKKKKKKKSKKAGGASKDATPSVSAADTEAARIRIARNKHMRFISSYHGPWLQLPTEILESLLRLNCDASALSAASDANARRELQYARARSPTSRNCKACEENSQNGLNYRSSMDGTSRKLDDSRHHPHNHPITTFDEIAADMNENLPPPIDPAVFRGSVEIRNLVDGASDLAVRAASGLSAAALGALAASTANAGGSVAAALGLENTINGRSAAMSTTRQHRLRVMAVAKLAQAYSIDEVAASVAVMQGATAIDDIAEKVLKYEPGNIDAQLVGFFHEKIPSAPSVARNHAVFSQAPVLENLIYRYPERLNYFRSLGIWQTFKQDYSGAIDTFTLALEHAKTLRKAKAQRNRRNAERSQGKGSKKRGKNSRGSGHVSAYDAASAALQGDADEDGPSKERIEPSNRSVASRSACEEAAEIGHEPGDDVARQMMFFRGMARYQLAATTIEKAVLGVERAGKAPAGLSNEGGELTLENIGIDVPFKAKELPRGSLIGSCNAEKLPEYQKTLLGSGDEPGIQEQVRTLLKQSTKDFEEFLSYFAVWEAPSGSPNHTFDDERRNFDVPNQHLVRSHSERSIPFRGRKLIHHRSLNGRTRYSDPRTRPDLPAQTALLTTYHPLMIEAHFSVLLNLLLLGDIPSLLDQHYRIARLMDYIEGYPVFVPARSLNQSQYAEVMELLACSWLAAREKDSAISIPPLYTTETDILHQRGEAQALHHLVGYFTEEHNRRLEEAAVQAEKDVAVAAAATLKERASNGSSKRAITGRRGRTDLLERRLLEEAAAAGVPKEDEFDSGPSKKPLKFLEGPTYNTARSEVAVAWLQIAVLPELEEAERQLDLNRSRTSAMEGSSRGQHGNSGDARPGSSASTMDINRSSSSRPVSPLSPPAVIHPGTDKGKGKEKVPSFPEPSLSSPALEKGKGKGKGRAIPSNESSFSSIISGSSSIADSGIASSTGGSSSRR